MASRYIDTAIWEEDWFCEMPGEYQHFVRYIFDNCDNAGVWKPKKFDFETKSKFKIDLERCFEMMNSDEALKGSARVLKLENGRWFLTGYIHFQWFNKKPAFTLLLTNRLHNSLHDILLTNNIPLTSVRGLKEVQKTSMVMVMDMVMEEVKEGGVQGEKPSETKIELPATKTTQGHWNQFPISSDVQLTLPKEIIRAVIEQMKITKDVDISSLEVEGLFSVFTVTNLTGDKNYPSPKEVFKHFVNWIKTQNIDKHGYGKAKQGGSRQPVITGAAKSAGSLRNC